MEFNLNEVFQAGVKYFLQGEQFKAERIFTTILDQYPDYYDVFPFLGWIWYDREDWKQACYCYKKAVQNKPDNYFLIFYLASTYVNMHEYKTAEKWFKKLEEAVGKRDDRKAFMAEIGRGEMMEVQGKYAEAIKKYYNALYMLPKPFEYDEYFAVYFDRVLCQVIDDIGLSFSPLFKKWRESPSGITPIRMAVWNAMENLLEEVAKTYLNPQPQYTCLKILGGMNYELERYKKALPSLVNALEIREDEYFMWDILGDCLVNLGEPKKAKEAFEKALERNPDDEWASEMIESL